MAEKRDILLVSIVAVLAVAFLIAYSNGFSFRLDPSRLGNSLGSAIGGTEVSEVAFVSVNNEIKAFPQGMPIRLETKNKDGYTVFLSIIYRDVSYENGGEARAVFSIDDAEVVLSSNYDTLLDGVALRLTSVKAQ